MVEKRVLSGKKGGSSKSASSAPDTLFSNDKLEVILGISEGPIKGLVDGSKSFFVNDTPLTDVAGEANFKDFELSILPGTPLGDYIYPRLGGTGSVLTVNVALDTNVPVTRQAVHTNLDYLDIRVLIQRLLTTSGSGEAGNSVEFKIEIKPASSSTWINPVIEGYTADNTSSPFITGTGSEFSRASSTITSVPNPLVSYSTVSPAITAPAGTVWFAPASGYAPRVVVGSSWAAPAGLTTATGLYRWGSNTLFVTTDLSVVPTPETGRLNFWMVTGDPQLLQYNSSAWVTTPDAFSGVIAAGDPRPITISGKTTSGYVREFRVRVNRINEPYQVRLTKLSPANTTTAFSDIIFESVGEINVNALIFPGLATAQVITRASEQLSSFPELSGVYEGRLIKVPTNYNPVTRVYTGVWDGLFKVEYSDNIAWCVYDLVTDTNYGLSAYQPVSLDKWATYAFGQHCDRHGFTYNDYIQEARPVDEQINYICGIAGGRFIDYENGTATIVFATDDEPAVMLFTPENVVDGLFSYSFTDITTRKNDFTVSFINPDIGWREDRRRVFDQADIDKFDRNPEEFIAVGCINEEEAIRRARLRLITSLTERAVVSFKTNRVGSGLDPYSIILIADGVTSTGLSGRILSIDNSGTYPKISFRDALFMEPGFTYQVKFQWPDAHVETHSIVAASGAVYEIQLSSTPSQPLLVESVFTLECADTVGQPRAYRVNAIEEADGDPDNLAVSATEVNRLKWEFVDGEVSLTDIPYKAVRNRPVAPDTVWVEASTLPGGRHDLTVRWTPTTTEFNSGYRIFIYRDDLSTFETFDTRFLSHTVLDAQPAIYTFVVTTLNLLGDQSPGASISHNVRGALRQIMAPTNPRVLGRQDHVFLSQSPTFVWDSSVDSYFEAYEVQVRHLSTGVVLHEAETTDAEFTYPYSLNTTNHGGVPARSFVVRVRVRDTIGNKSPWVDLTASNPPPSAPESVVVSVNTMTVTINFAVPAGVPDWASTTVHASHFPNFAVGSDTKKFEGRSNTITFPIDTPGLLYVKVGISDSFDGTIVYAPETSTDTSGSAQVDFDQISHRFMADLSNIKRRLSDAEDYIAATVINAATRTDQLVQTVGGARAEYTRAIAVLASEDAALVQEITTLSASFASNNALVTNQFSVLTTANTALSQQITNLTASTGSSIAGLQTSVNALVAVDTAFTQQITALSASTGASIAGLQTSINTLTSADTAFTQQINTLSATVGVQGTTLASISSQYTTLVNSNSALTTSVTQLSAQVNNTSASGYIRFEAGVAPAGVTSRYEMAVQTDVGGTTKKAGLAIEVIGAGASAVSRVKLLGDQALIDSPYFEIQNMFIRRGVNDNAVTTPVYLSPTVYTQLEVTPDSITTGLSYIKSEITLRSDPEKLLNGHNLIHSNYYYRLNDDGTMTQLTNSGGLIAGGGTPQGPRFNPFSINPLMKGISAGQTVYALQSHTSTSFLNTDYVKIGSPFRVPFGVTSVTAKLWGAGGLGNGYTPNAYSGARGGPGGFVQGTFTVTPGEWLFLIVGVRGQPFYFGGSFDTRMQGFAVGGGGLTGLFRGEAAVSTALLIAGGGGMGGTSSGYNGAPLYAGGPGGAATAGEAGYTGDLETMWGNPASRLPPGYPGSPTAGQYPGVGGGGYEGGGSFVEIGSVYQEAGRGGKNYVHPSCTNVLNEAATRGTLYAPRSFGSSSPDAIMTTMGGFGFYPGRAGETAYASAGVTTGHGGFAMLTFNA